MKWSGADRLGLDKEPCNELALGFYYEVIPYTLLGVDGVDKAVNCARLQMLGSKLICGETRKMYGLVSVKSLVVMINVVR